MESLLSPPLNIQLLDTSPAQSYEEVQNSISTCLADHDLLPYVIGANTLQIKNHLIRIRDEVAFLRHRRKASRKHSSKKPKQEHKKRPRKSKSSTQAIVID
ncbi:hypothetical protein PGT21_035103 [Puccinia graminis f. sp. tritici]|uniref:Uncharacterized protein n=1 Tax=Puccinia graminis f. sp. tritici TaxID=56615 RepID=A0A5B0MGV2_PUCGR|nr:hypothetical protein PGTUg99_026559 [Puccinia graminis f. sp. tritici]KAA1075339.1 hypothetical protein PGT21_033993 [Puccinia graminis f. sp. tritici]KAA1081389.1 hypothetical protein PGT21_035103 [Puccinia graminis f. sp. tritici]KAA1091974.1 hypothetical protein PGTUg99_002457 [Puccinia graminis f. sp. tritici]